MTNRIAYLLAVSIFVAAAYSIGATAVGQLTLGWNPNYRMAIYIAFILGSVYLWLLLLSSKFRYFESVYSFCTNVPKALTAFWAVIGLFVPSVSIGLSWLVSDHNFRGAEDVPRLLFLQTLSAPSIILLALLEEIVFRGVLLTALLHSTGQRKCAMTISFSVEGLIFAICHSDMGTLGNVRMFIFALLASLISTRSKSIIPSTALHASANLVMTTAFGSKLAPGILYSSSGYEMIIDSIMYTLSLVGAAIYFAPHNDRITGD